MRQLLFVAVSVFLGATTTFASDPSGPVTPAAAKATDTPAIPKGWVGVTPPDAGFRAAFPARPTVEKPHLANGGAGVEMVIYDGSPKGGDVYLVTVTKLPDGVDCLAYADRLFAGVLKGMLATTEGGLETEKPVTVERPGIGGPRSFPGRDYEGTAPHGLRFSARVIVTEHRVYTLLLMSKGEKSKAYSQFLSTFSLE
ncbi:hypothetical protein ACQKGO_23895 [Corallococcus interemptor]|uniref:hypothetical protein n=1 Tax=Corallococcus interemptor TaxID=2316720 RepID=UPI003CFF8DE2